MKDLTKGFKFKFRIVDGAVDIADDYMVIALTRGEAENLVMAYDMTEDETFDIDWAKGADEIIEADVEEFAERTYGGKINDKLYVYLYDLRESVEAMRQWVYPAD